MSRQTYTRVRCVRCFYGYAELACPADDVDDELAIRGWGKSKDGDDLCGFCIEAETARGIRRKSIWLAQATQLLRINGLDESAVYAKHIIQAQEAAIEAIREEQA